MQVKMITAASLAASVVLAAQSPQQPQPVAAVDWMTPIHTQQDDETGGAYGTWAAGPDYKVSFDRGYTFYPVLGQSYRENLPLAWSTERITIGDRTLVDAATAADRHHSDWRYELRYGEVTEAYDVLREGIEQTFVLAQPVGSGDFVVHGRITTKLRAAFAPAAHQPLAFADESGRELVRYGRAFAVDATGRKLELATSFDGETVELRIPGAWLANAAYPVTLDPLTGRSQIAGAGSFGDARAVSIARDDTENQVMVVYTRSSSLTDVDAWGRLRDDSFGSVALAFTDLSDNWSTSAIQAAHSRSGSVWLLAMQRASLLGGSWITVYRHDGGDTTTNSGGLTTVPRPAGAFDQRPSIGGNTAVAAGANSLLVFQRDLGSFSSAASRVYAVTVNPNGAFGVLRNLHTNGGIPSYDAEYPSVSGMTGNADSWIVVWQEYNDANGNDDWDIIGQRVRSSGTLAGDAVFGRSSAFSRHKVLPVVAGRGGRYALAYLMQDKVSKSYTFTGDEIAMQRFDWSNADASPVIFDNQTIATSASDDLSLRLATRPIAYDNNSDSHWALAYRDGDTLQIVRCGFTGLVVEQAAAFADAGETAFYGGVCFNDDANEFQVAFGTDEAAGPVYGRRFQRGSPMSIPYGTGCFGSLSTFNRGSNLPHAGSQFFGIELNGGAPNAPTVLLLGLGQGNFPLPGNCPLLLDPFQQILDFPGGVSDVAGNYVRNIPLIDTVVNADLYWQVVQISLGQLVSSDGLETRIR